METSPITNVRRTPRRRHPALTVAGVAALLIVAAANARADTYPIVVVHANKPPCVTPNSAVYNSIQTAINAAPSGASIVVCPDTYPEQITIGKPLTLRGVTDVAHDAGAAIIIIPAGGLASNFTSAQAFLGSQPVAAQVLVQANNVFLNNIAVDGTGANTGCTPLFPRLVGIAFDTGSSGTLTRVAVRNQDIPAGTSGDCTAYGIVSVTGGSVTIQDSSVRGFANAGFSGLVQATSTVIRATVFVASPNGPNPFNACADVRAATVEIIDNITVDCGTGVALEGQPTQGNIARNTITNVQSGISCDGHCSGLNVYYNRVAHANAGISDRDGAPGSGGGFFGSTFQYNDISGVDAGFFISPGGGNSVSYNTINDASLGIGYVSGNSVSNNTFLNVTRLTQ